MISARRAREADLDKAFSLGLRAGAIYRRTRAHARAEIGRQQAHMSSSAKADDPVFREAGCKAETFRSTGYPAFAGYDKNDHRTAHLEHAERPQDISRAGGDGA